MPLYPSAAAHREIRLRSLNGGASPANCARKIAGPLIVFTLSAPMASLALWMRPNHEMQFRKPEDFMAWQRSLVHNFRHVCRCRKSHRRSARQRYRRRNRQGTLRSPHPVPVVQLVAAKGRPLGMCLRSSMEYLRHRRRLSSMPSSVDYDAVPRLLALVCTFAMVCERVAMEF